MLRRHRGAVALAVLAGVAAGGSSALLIALISLIQLHGVEPVDGAPREMLAFVVLAVLTFLAHTSSQIASIRLAETALVDIRIGMAERLMGTSLRRLEEAGHASILSMLTEDAERLKDAIRTIPDLFIHSAEVLGCLIYLGWMSWKVLVIVLLTVIAGHLLNAILSRSAWRFFEQARTEQATVLSHLQRLTAGIKELKLHQDRSRSFLRDGLQASSQRLQRDLVAGTALLATSASSLQLLLFGAFCVILFAPVYAPWLEIGRAGAYGLAIIYMINSIYIIAARMPIFARARISLERLEHLGLGLDTGDAGITAAPEPARPAVLRSGIELRQVVHTYIGEDQSAFTLGPIDFHIPRGQLLTVAGYNGSGKTTLAKIITGLYVPESGQVLLDGEEITDATRGSYRQLFSTVFSDFYLSERLDEIAVPDLEASARKYLAMLRLDHKVQIREGRLSTTALSQGQRKRLALLNTYLEDRQVYLFDEWAADQDPVFKSVFYRQLLPDLKQRGKTVIVISHDDRYFDISDRVLTLVDGRIGNNDIFGAR